MSRGRGPARAAALGGIGTARLCVVFKLFIIKIRCVLYTYYNLLYTCISSGLQQALASCLKSHGASFVQLSTRLSSAHGGPFLHWVLSSLLPLSSHS